MARDAVLPNLPVLWEAAVVASAEVTRDGELRPVDGLAAKARLVERLVERLLPGVRWGYAPRGSWQCGER